jgi:uncharacterized repeat protein (TIGR03847 family)
MAGELVDFNPVSRITIGAVGQPGQRIFLLQANQGSASITLKLEKEQAMVLATSTIELLEELEQKFPRSQSRFSKPLSSDLLLREPLEPTFAIGQIGLGYDQERDLIVLVVQELPFEGLEKPATARFWASRSQMQALCDHTLEVASQGRPLCPLCDQPMDPEGHFCPRSNGHEKPLWS